MRFRACIAVAFVAAIGLAASSAVATEQVTVGNAKVIVKTVTGAFEGEMRELHLLDDVYHNELIETAEESATQLVFLDDTAITLGPKSRIVLDRFVYDPDPSKAAFVMTATQGVFRFASGKLPKAAYQIHTPAATIGIRGTVLQISVLSLASPAGGLQVAVEVLVDSGEAELVTRDGAKLHVAAGDPPARVTTTFVSP